MTKSSAHRRRKQPELVRRALLDGAAQTAIEQGLTNVSLQAVFTERVSDAVRSRMSLCISMVTDAGLRQKWSLKARAAIAEKDDLVSIASRPGVEWMPACRLGLA